MGLIIKLASIFYDKAGIQFFDGPRRREAAGGHKPKINFAYWRISYRSRPRAGVAVMDAASGPNLTIQFAQGFPVGLACAVEECTSKRTFN